MIDIVGFFQKVLDWNRPHVLNISGGEQVLFQPAKNGYEKVSDMLLPKARSRSISNAEALLEVVIE